MGETLAKRLQKKKTELSQKGGNSNFFFFKEGTVRMRLVPVGAEKEFAIEATYFYLGNDIKGVVSPVTFGEPCAIMEAYQRLKNSKDDDDREMAKKVAPKKRYFALHYKYTDEKGKQVDTEAGVRLAILTNQQYQDLIDLYLDEEAGDMTDPKNGYDIKYKRTGSGQFDTEYSILRCNPTPIAKEFKGKVYDPESALKKVTPTYEQTEEFVQRVLGVSTPAEKPIKKKKKKKKLSK
jgi:hypothetical protein